MTNALALTFKQAAEAAGVTEGDIINAIKAGSLTARLHRNRALVQRTELQSWLDSLPKWAPKNTAPRRISGVRLNMEAIRGALAEKGWTREELEDGIGRPLASIGDDMTLQDVCRIIVELPTLTFADVCSVEYVEA